MPSIICYLFIIVVSANICNSPHSWYRNGYLLFAIMLTEPQQTWRVWISPFFLLPLWTEAGSFFAWHRIIIKTHTVHGHSPRNYLMISFQIAFQSESQTIWMFIFCFRLLLAVSRHDPQLDWMSSEATEVSIKGFMSRLHLAQWPFFTRHYCKAGKNNKASAIAFF